MVLETLDAVGRPEGRAGNAARVVASRVTDGSARTCAESDTVLGYGR